MTDASAAGPTTITIDDFLKLDLRVGTVLSAEPHPNADKLMVLQVDLGAETRQIIAGIRAHYDAGALLGKQIVVVANLAPRAMRGLDSQGMLLAASSEDRSQCILVGPQARIAAGSRVG